MPRKRSELIDADVSVKATTEAVPGEIGRQSPSGGLGGIDPAPVDAVDETAGSSGRARCGLVSIWGAVPSELVASRGGFQAVGMAAMD